MFSQEETQKIVMSYSYQIHVKFKEDLVSYIKGERTDLMKMKRKRAV